MLLRNPEIRKLLLVYGIFSILAAAGALFWSSAAALYVLIVCLGSALVFLVFTAGRYRKLSDLSCRVDQFAGYLSVGLSPWVFAAHAPVLPILAFTLAILFFTGLAYALGYMKICGGGIIEALKDETTV